MKGVADPVVQHELLHVAHQGTLRNVKGVAVPVVCSTCGTTCSTTRFWD